MSIGLILFTWFYSLPGIHFRPVITFILMQGNANDSNNTEYWPKMC